MRLRPPTAPALQTAADDPRIGALLGRGLGEGGAPRVALVGFAVDEGVVRNRGRAGAAEGPNALRERLYRLCPDPALAAPFGELLARTCDLGDVVGSGDLAADQARLAQVVSAQLRQGRVVVVLGGGHETSFGHFLGYADAGLPVAIANLDAHADVRELRDGQGHSGSPFRQALCHPSGLCRGYRVAGLQRSAVSAAHLAFLRQQGASWSFAEQDPACEAWSASAYRAGTPDVGVLATFCLDALDQAFAPGVSAPAAGGLSPRAWLRAAEAAGASPAVRSMDVVELNPRFDRDGQTARLAALTVWSFLRGLCMRADS